MTGLTRGEWGRVYAAASLLVADGESTEPAHLVEVLVDGQRQLDYAAAVETVEGALDDGPIEETPGGEVVCVATPKTSEDETTHPPTIKDREYWVTWALDSVGRKRPRAPWHTGHAYPAEWRDALDDDEQPMTDFETAAEYAELDAHVVDELGKPDDDPGDTLDVGIILPKDRPERDERITLVDWDDVRNSETGATHPLAAAFIEYYPGFAEISQSGKGIHQFVLGGLDPHNRKKLIVEIDDDPFIDDALPQVELYDGGRHVAMTGRHVRGTASDAVPGQPFIDALVERFGGSKVTATSDSSEVPEEKQGAFNGVDLTDRPDGRPKCYHAVLKAREHSDDLDHIANWELIGYAAMLGAAHGLEDETILEDLHPEHGGHGTPQYGFDPNREPREVRRVTPDVRGGDLHPPNAETLAKRGILPDAGRCGCELHERGSHRAENRAGVETCAAPAPDRDALDVDVRRDELEGPRYDEYIAADGPVAWVDEPGIGKTTNAALAAAKRDRPHAVLFDKHRKAREFQQDAVTPGEYFHLKGGPQKRDGECMDADHAGEDCPNHGHPSNCPRMCPFYDLGEEHDVRRLYEQLVDEVGPVEAHVIVTETLDDVPGHDEDGQCAWLEQFDEAARADRLVGVHEYQTLKTVQEVRDGPRRDVILDESVDPSSVARGRDLDVKDLVRLANALEQVGRYDGAPDALDALAEFARSVVDCLTDRDAPDRLADLDPPEFDVETIEIEVDPDDLPEDVDPDEVEQTTKREYPGMPEEGHRNVTRHVVERELVDEALARAKLEYNETILRRIGRDDWDGAPLAVDTLLAAMIPTGADADAVRRAIAAPERLDHCPRCGGELHDRDGRRLCPPEDGCGWDEADDYLVGKDAEPARAQAQLEADPRAGEPCLSSRQLPAVSDLPSRPLLLDATASRKKIAGLYGVPIDDVDVAGDDRVELENFHNTKVLDGQYHYSTLEQSDTARERTERSVAKLADIHENLLVVGRRAMLKALDLPEDVTMIHYHAARGLNFEDHDAVVAIGAPHPNIEELQRDAELLAQGRADLRVGGEEHSTRRDAPNPPVYRKLDYADANGRGRAVPTKHYTGLVGELFREKRERELEQVVHRIRPVLADETKHSYVLSNVPTDLQVDEVCSFEELADPLEALLPVADGALRLAEYIEDAVTGEYVPDGFRAAEFDLVEYVGGDRDGEERAEFNVSALHTLAHLRGEDVSEKTIRRWKNDLEDIGLLDAGAYEHREGVPYSTDVATLTRALSVISSNAGVEVAAIRRFRTLVEAADGSLTWLNRARDLLGLSGDRCGVAPPSMNQGDPASIGSD